MLYGQKYTPPHCSFSAITLTTLLNVTKLEFSFAYVAPWLFLEHIVGVPAVRVLRCSPFQARSVAHCHVPDSEVFVGVVAIVTEIIWKR